MQRESSAGYITRAPRSSGLADVLEILLDRGLVIDAYVRVSLVGIELLTVDLRVVIASVDTYLRFAEAVNRLDLRATDDSMNVPEMLEEGGEKLAESKARTKGAPARAPAVAATTGAQAVNGVMRPRELFPRRALVTICAAEMALTR